MIKKIWIPKTIQTQPVRSTKEIRILSYKHRDSKSGLSQHLTTKTIATNEQRELEYAKHLLSLGFSHAVHLIPVPSVDVMSLRYKIQTLMNHLQKVHTQIVKEGGIAVQGTLPYYTCIEFGEKLQGIHAHCLLFTNTTERHIRDIWSKLNKGARENACEVDTLSLSNNPLRLIQYCSSLEDAYNQIDEELGTNYANHLVIHSYDQRWFRPTIS